jgi:thiol-disulfide isomerase/thioredoxin
MLTAMVSAQNCHITGRVAVSNLQNKSISIMNLNTGNTLGETTIADSVFTFDIEVAEPFVALLKTDPQYPSNANSYYFMRIVAEPGSIYADLVTDSLSGTPLNDRYYQYSQERDHEVRVLNAIYSQLNESVNAPADVQEELRGKMEKGMKRLFSWMRDTYDQNKDNAIGALVIENLIEYDDQLDYKTLIKMLEGAAPVVTTYMPLKAKLDAMERLSHTVAGQPYVDLDLTDYKTGKPIKLSEVVDGKVALIDFWASWCRPCRAEVPYIKGVYEKYKDNKDLVVISLDVWDKPDAQAKAIQDLGMTWTQLTDATSKATDTYGVDGIPQILLIGRDGIIVARDLRGAEIEKAVKKALEK